MWTLLVYLTRLFIVLIALAVASVSLLPALLFLILCACLKINPVIAALASIGATIPLYIYVPSLFIVCFYTALGLEGIFILGTLVILIKEYRARRALRNEHVPFTEQDIRDEEARIHR